MFTTQVGQPDLGEDYLRMLRDAVDHNLARDGGLRDALQARAGTSDSNQLQRDHFEIFFNGSS